MNRNFPSRCKGITLVEILLVVGLLIIVASFAAPSISGASTRVEMHAAAEHIEYSIEAARDAARMAESEVSMNIHSDAATGQQIISFTVSDSAAKTLSQPDMQEYRLSANLTIRTDHPSYKFDGRGVVQNPGSITLLAKNDEELTENFILQ